MQISVQTDLRQLITDSKKSMSGLKYAYGQLIDLSTWTFNRLIYLTPKSGHTREGERVADTWELKYERYVFLRELEWSILSDNKIIEYLEDGTNEHWIYPKSPGGTLHWIDPKTGKHAFSKGHWVRGIQAVGMIRQTAAELEIKIQKFMTNVETKISN